MPACLAVKENKQTLDLMREKTETNIKQSEDKKLDTKTKLASYAVTGTDINFELLNIYYKIGGVILSFYMPPVGMALSKLTDTITNIQSRITRSVQECGAAIVGINKDEVFIYDFVNKKRVPAFDGNNTKANLVKGMLGNTDIVEDLVKPIAQAIPEIIKEMPTEISER